MFKMYAVVFALPVLTYRACDSCDGSTTPPDPIDACADYVGQATEGEIAATPRAQPSLEAMAIAMDPGFVADPAVYDRLVADMAAIYTLEPEVAGITYRSPYSATRLLVGASSATLSAMQSGTYDGWECENEWYEASGVQVHSSFAVVTFPGTYDMEALADEYAALPNIDYAEPDGVIGGGSTVCGVIGTGGRHDYLVDRAWGDCPAGCINHEYYYFQSTGPGAVTYQGSWDAQSGDPAPLWSAVADCF